MRKHRVTKVSSAACHTDHTGDVPTERLASLGESQAGPWRHRCAACAYQMGYQDALRAMQAKHPIQIVGPRKAPLGKLNVS